MRTQEFHNRAFSIFFCALVILFILTGTRDWWYDLAFFGIVYVVFWFLLRRWPTTRDATILLLILPAPHLLGALGLYHWAIGPLSWDVIVHTMTAFLGVLFLYAWFRHIHISRFESILALTAIILTMGALVEGVEWAGGRLASSGEGVFFRGAGDFCTVTHPCTEDEDAQKDMINNIIGLALGILAVSYHRVRMRTT